MKSKVYTRSGDKGKTSLFGGARVEKDDVRLEAYGTVDELNSYVGLLRSYVKDEHISDMIIDIQNQLFKIGSYLATDDSMADYRSEIKLDNVIIEALETKMDRMDSSLPPIKGFILPGGHLSVSFCHIARTVCRRAERKVITMQESYEVDSWIIRYLNRLSDYLFVLSRYFSVTNNIEEIHWNSKL